GVLDAAERLVGEHDAEAERVVGRVALPHGDLGVRSEPLGQRGEVEPARPTADNGNAHGASLVAQQCALIAVFPPRRAPTSLARRVSPDAARRTAVLTVPPWSPSSAP